MFRKFIIGVAMLAAGAIGGAVLHAQTAAAPAYLIAHVQITDQDGWKQYITALPGTLAPYHVKTPSGTGDYVLEGEVNLVVGSDPVILAFNSMDDLKAWWNSPAYQAIIPLREKSAKTVVYALPGQPPQN